MLKISFFSSLTSDGTSETTNAATSSSSGETARKGAAAAKGGGRGIDISVDESSTNSAIFLLAVDTFDFGALVRSKFSGDSVPPSTRC